MIDDKKIEEAAFEEYPLNSDGNIIGRNGFKEGAKWAINELIKNLWHPASEEPKEKVPLLYYRKHKFLPFMVDKHSDVYDWNTLVYNFDITKWLYIEDLFPKEGGEK